jgi:serine/threonine-protein kinase
LDAPLTAVELADALLWSADQQGAWALAVEPEESGHRVSLQFLTGWRSAPLPAGLGEALVIRLALLAGIDPWSRDSHLGRLEIVSPRGPGEFLVAVRASPRGFSAELRRTMDASSATLDEATVITLREGEASTLAGGVPRAIGSYEVLAELGRGAMGTVYSCRGKRGKVAIKVLHRHLANDARLAALFVSEGHAASLADDPGIVQVHDFGSLPDHRPYLVMEFVEGQTLEAALAAGILPPRRSLRIVRRIATALHAAHVRGVVHRDLKPSNVFLRPDDAIKIADFGAAEVRWTLRGNAGSSPDLIIGTPAYMAPEQARGQQTDERADVYSLGCILFRLLTGRLPHTGRNLAELLEGQLKAAPLEAVGPGGRYPEAVQLLVRRTLAADPAARYPTMADLVADLDRAALQLPESGRTS